MQLLFYREPLGLPLRWQDEQSGQLKEAVLAYLNHAEGDNPLPETQRDLVFAWCRYYINAPCWMDNARRGGDDAVNELLAVMAQANDMRTEEDIGKWIDACMELGIDPL